MSLRSVLIVLLALVCGGSAAVGVSALRNAPPPEAPPPAETVPVVVAAVDVPRFTTLSPDMLKTHDFPKDLAPPGALNRVEDATDRVSVAEMVADEPVLSSKLASRGAGHGMAPGIAKGMRAFTIQTPNVATGVAGFILPGNKVDVLLTLNGVGNDATGGGSTFTLLQNLEILAVDQHVDTPRENKVDPNLRSVTLLVTPQQALRLDLGQNRGTLHLALRNPEDGERALTKRATLADLGLEDTAPEPKKDVVVPVAEPTKPPPPAKIRTLRNTQMGMVELD